MAVTHTWSVAPNGLQTKTVEGVTDVVTAVRLNIHATDGVNSFDTHQLVFIPLEDINTIVPFAQLTEAQVIEWAKEKLGSLVSAIEDSLAKQLAHKANPPTPAVFKNGPWIA